MINENSKELDLRNLDIVTEVPAKSGRSRHLVERVP